MERYAPSHNDAAAKKVNGTAVRAGPTLQAEPDPQERARRRAKREQGLRRELQDKLKSGSQVTLVLGAGVSASRKLPLWEELLRGVWRRVLGNDPLALDRALLKRCKALSKEQGVPAEFVDQLDVKRHPLELQLGFERIFDELRRKKIEHWKHRLHISKETLRAVALAPERQADFLFAELLREVLYNGQPKRTARWSPKKNDTLSLVAGAIRANALRPSASRTISRVITFNVDDLLERVVNSGRSIPLAYPVRWASDARRPPGKEAIGIYHLHGFVPQEPEDYPFYSSDGGLMKVRLPLETLVFSDEQYWRALGNPGDFASRVFAQALAGTCVFLGVSMTDINLLRWLAQHAAESRRDLNSMTTWEDSFEAWYEQSIELSDHYWITDGDWVHCSSKPQGLGEDLLKTVLRSNRGVQPVHFPCWKSEEFYSWWRECFYSDTGRSAE